MLEETFLPRRDSMRKFNKNSQNHLLLEKRKLKPNGKLTQTYLNGFNGQQLLCNKCWPGWGRTEYKFNQYIHLE